MDKKIIAYFEEKNQAEEAIQEIRNSGFENNEISILGNEENQDENKRGNQILADGAIAGGAYGGIAGFALTAGAFLVPGVGPILAVGPLGGILAGALTGGVAGALIDYGIPEEQSKHYEEKLQEGNIITVLQADEEQIEEAAEILRNHGAKDVKVNED